MACADGHRTGVNPRGKLIARRAIPPPSLITCRLDDLVKPGLFERRDYFAPGHSER
jgi:hypothetical protein